MITLDQIKDQDGLQSLINVHKDTLRWAKNRPHQKNLDRGRDQVANQANKLYRLLEEFRLDLHVPRDGTLQRITVQNPG